MTKAQIRVAAGEAAAPADYESIRGRVLIGMLLGLLLILGMGGWAASARLTGAVVVQGAVKVDQNLKSVQHRDGGIVSDIRVREGDVVAAGQVLIRLEDAQSRAELSILRAQYLESLARQARLKAERDGLALIEFPSDLTGAGPAAETIVRGETRLLNGNNTNRESQKQQLELSIQQIGEELIGLEAQRDALNREIIIVDEEHLKIETLVAKKLVEASRLVVSERERVQLRGRLGEVDATIARSRARIGEVRLRILAIDEMARTEAQRELVQVETRLQELAERITAVEDRLSHTDIRAPISGTVNELNVHTIGGVITPAEVLVTIVPADARLRVEVRLPPTAIDQVYPGQAARLRFTAFNQSTTPELAATLAQVSPATSRDPATGETFYLGYLDVTQAELDRLGAVSLVPGMPAEVYIATQDRTALAYLAKPMTDQFRRAFREE
jgi:HlyD family type I secretion membrane fusion protein